MLAFYGTELFGKTDVIDGVGHVSTEFFHVTYIPIMPLRCFLVLDDDQGALQIPMSAKAVLAAYGRALTIFLGLACVAGGLLAPVMAREGAGAEAWIVGAAFAAFGIALAASTWIFGAALRKPSEVRRAELLRWVQEGGSEEAGEVEAG